MKKCLLIIPYFGVLPNYFQLFLDSCSKSRFIDFFILTDDRQGFNYPSNVKVKYCNLEFVRELAKSKINKNICLDSAMKLCDFKPTYGYLFENYLSDYKYWGHCDIDLIFGDLDTLVVPIIDTLKYDKIFNLGHLTLYRNREDINSLFFQEIKDNKENSVFFKSSMCKFDEENYGGSIINYFLRNSYNIYSHQLEADIATKSNRLILDIYDFCSNSHRYFKRKNLFIYDNGKIKCLYHNANNLAITEYAYIHLQKRKMKVEFPKSTNQYVIAANKFYVPPFLDFDDVKLEDFHKVRTFFINSHYVILRWKNFKVKLKRVLARLIK